MTDELIGYLEPTIEFVATIEQLEIVAEIVAVGPKGADGADGAPGLDGKDGVDGASIDNHYSHIQLTPAAVWNIQHNMNKYPVVFIMDSAGTNVTGRVEYTDLNNIAVYFVSQGQPTAFAGRAELN